MTTTSLYFSIFALLLVMLFLNIVRLRINNKVSLGDGGMEELKKARSAHENFVETVPFVLILMMLAETNGAPALALHGIGILMLVSRGFHIHGVYQENSTGTGRMVGSVIFILLMALGAAWFLFSSLFA